MKIPFYKPNIPKDFGILFSNSIKSGWLTTGSQVKKFEENLQIYLNAENVIGLNSCTAALHLALAAKDFGNGDKFILPTLTFASTIECGEYVGMEPILIDSEDNGFLFDLNQVEDIVKKDSSVKVIIPVHYAGEAVDLNTLWTLADKYNLFVLEDAAHALESTSGKIKVGNTNYAAAFSFYANKNITTGGEGGALATNNNKLAEKIKRLSLHGITRDGWDRFKSNGKWEYDIVNLGFKYNLTDFSASFGLWQMNYIAQWQLIRKQIIDRYIDGLGQIEGFILPKINDGHARHLFVIQLVPGKWSISRNKFIEEMNKRGIGLAVHYKPIHILSYYQNKYNYNINNYPRANNIYNNIVSLPLYPNLSRENVNYIINSILEIHNQYGK